MTTMITEYTERTNVARLWRVFHSRNPNVGETFFALQAHVFLFFRF